MDIDDESYLNSLDEQEENFAYIKPRLRDQPRRNVAEVAETTGLESGFTSTYKPSRHEAGWLLDSLRTFYEQNLVRDVLYLVKGGKEANVYCCEAGTAGPAGVELVAAKVYRPRQFRNLRNDHLYREGRAVLTSEGRAVKNSDGRMMRALGKKTDFGAQVQHTSWLMHEFNTLERLHRAGVAVPRAFSASENAVLMGYIGSREAAAPTLSEITLKTNEATALFRTVLQTVETMLRENVIHGDLSAYNLLYWEGDITLIDFPQITSPQSNPHARTLFERDVTRVCEYFLRQGVRCNAAASTSEIWGRVGLGGE
ncbi:MAG: hypothetical protein H7145_17420 [Akkermansiaceae bacterium]|nr:hypothetical protein [Armatimonadota bacterium]